MSIEPFVVTTKSDVFVMYLMFRVGSIYEDDTNRGISHCIEHMLFKSTSTHATRDVLHTLTKIGGLYNAVTDKDVTYYYIKTESKNWKTTIDILVSMWLTPKLLEKEWSNEKHVIMEEISQKDDSMYDQALLSLFSKKHPYVNSVGSIPEKIKNITSKDLKDYYSRYYLNPQNITCAFYCSHQVKQSALQYFRKVMHNNVHRFIFDKLLPTKQLDLPPRPRIVFHKEDGSNTVTLTFKSYNVHDWKKLAVLNLLNYILAQSSLYSVLLFELRENRGLVYNISCVTETYQHLSYTQIVFDTKFADIAFIIKKIRSILERIKTKGISAKALDLYRESYKSMYKYVMYSSDIHFGIKALNHHYGVSNFSVNQYLDVINNATIDSIMSCAKDIYKFDNMGIFINGNFKQKDIQNVKALIHGKIYGERIMNSHEDSSIVQRKSE